MMNLVGGLTIVVEADRDVSYSEVEDALKVEGFLSDYLINRSTTPGRTQLTISVHVPMSAITADGVPVLEAVGTLRAVANAISAIDVSQ
ncbi:MAG: hypothetical protein ABR608_14970 [Pseudonocardiaceae bacterium]|nr:hypothetical protein [Actinomycetota bacterium]